MYTCKHLYISNRVRLGDKGFITEIRPFPIVGNSWSSEGPDQGLDVKEESRSSLPEASVWMDRSDLLESCFQSGPSRVWWWVWAVEGQQGWQWGGRAGWGIGKSRDKLDSTDVALCPSHLTAETFEAEWPLLQAHLPHLTWVVFSQL